MNRTQVISEDAAAGHRRTLWVLVAVAVALLWLLPAFSSLWLDETVTAWIADTSFDEMCQRGTEYSGGSPFYYIFPWLSLRVFGLSEFALRLPSLLAMALATVFVARIAQRLFDRDTAPLAALVFVLQQLVQFEARNARTYAVGLCCAAAATLALLRWLEKPGVGWALVYALCAALVFTTHVLFGALLILHLLIILGSLFVKPRRATIAQCFVLLVLLATALWYPLLAFAMSLFGRGPALIVMGEPYIEELTTALVPTAIVAAGLGALILARLRTSLQRDAEAPAMHRPVLLALALLYAVPPILFFCVARFSPIHIFIPRYFAHYAIAVALLLGWAWRQAGPRSARTLMAFALVGLACGAIVTKRHHSNEWESLTERVAAELATLPGAPVFANTGLIEAKDTSWLRDPEHSAYLLAPFHAYKLPAGHDIRALPWTAHPAEAQRYLEEQAAWLVATQRHFVVVSRDTSEPGFLPWFRGRLGPLGWTDRPIQGINGNLIAVVFAAPRSG